jgi:hypothetical protein
VDGTGQGLKRYVPKEGYITKWRRWESHRFHFTQENRPATRGEAWDDLLFKAAFRPHPRYFKGKEYHVNVGEIVTSQRDLAERWQWHRSTVRRYLDDLYEHGEATHHLTHDVTHISIHRLANPGVEQPTSRPTKRTTIEEVDLEVQEGTTPSSNKVQELVQWTLDKIGTKKKGVKE